ncbi:MAG: PASTA domain-containing protein [Clostridiales bacterium]|nr:PASTA domain-containing protein [Clostridiales bacterium]
MLQGILKFFYYTWYLFVLGGGVSWVFCFTSNKKDRERGVADKVLFCLSIILLIIGVISGAINLLLFTKTPNITDQRVRDAKYILSEHDLDIGFPLGQAAEDLDSIVTSQSPAANTIVLKGSKVIVSFNAPEQGKGTDEDDPAQPPSAGSGTAQTSTVTPAQTPASTSTTPPAQAPAATPTTPPVQAPVWTPPPTPAPEPIPVKDPYSDPFFTGNASVGGGITIDGELSDPEPEMPEDFGYPEQNVNTGLVSAPP